MRWKKKKENPDKIPDELITSFKTGTMGPVAAIGDTIHWGTAWTLGMALIASMAAKGNMISIAIMLALFAAFEVTAYLLFRLGYKTGRMSFTKIMKSGKLDELLDSANILGMFYDGSSVIKSCFLNSKLKNRKVCIKKYAGWNFTWIITITCSFWCLLFN